MYLLRRGITPKNHPKTPSKEVFERFSKVFLGISKVFLRFPRVFGPLAPVHFYTVKQQISSGTMKTVSVTLRGAEVKQAACTGKCQARCLV